MSTYEKYFGEFERMFFANCAITVLVQSCVGGIAAMAVLMNGTNLAQMVQLFFVVILSIGFNGTILSQQKPRVIYNAFLLAITANVLLAVINFAR
jgi:hypothetical protein